MFLFCFHEYCFFCYCDSFVRLFVLSEPDRAHSWIASSPCTWLLGPYFTCYMQLGNMVRARTCKSLPEINYTFSKISDVGSVRLRAYLIILYVDVEKENIFMSLSWNITFWLRAGTVSFYGASFCRLLRRVYSFSDAWPQSGWFWVVFGLFAHHQIKNCGSSRNHRIQKIMITERITRCCAKYGFFLLHAAAYFMFLFALSVHVNHLVI